MKERVNQILYEELKRIEERETFIPIKKEEGIKNYD